jgi:hypothetical protein
MRKIIIGPCPIAFDVFTVEEFHQLALSETSRDCLRALLRKIEKRGGEFWMIDVKGIDVLEECDHYIHMKIALARDAISITDIKRRVRHR